MVRKGVWILWAVCTDRGDCDLLDRLEALEANLQGNGDRMLSLLDMVAKQGPPHIVNINHTLKGPIWEFIQGRLRVLYFFDEGKVIICSHVVLKKSQKTPAKDIKRAEEACSRFLRGKQRNELLFEEEEDR